MADHSDINRKMRLGEILVRNGWVSWENLEKALAIQKEIENKEKMPIGAEVMLAPFPLQMLSLGEILVRNGWINWQQLDMALEIQKRTGQLLGKILVDLKFVSSKDCYRALAIQMNMVFIDFDRIRVDTSLLTLIPKNFAVSHKMMPVVKRDNALLIAVSNPSNIEIESELNLVVPSFKIHTGISSPDEIEKAIKAYYG